jgi:trans-aconitate methyltransferase
MLASKMLVATVASLAAPSRGTDCGKLTAGQELVWLAEALPERQICGIDLAEGMVDVARHRLEAAGLGCGSPPGTMKALR